MSAAKSTTTRKKNARPALRIIKGRRRDLPPSPRPEPRSQADGEDREVVRVVLAVDDLLAQAVKSEFDGEEVVQVRREEMRSDGDDLVRRLVLAKSPSVLAIGDTAWNGGNDDPLALLERWKLPRKIQIVLVASNVAQALARARRARVSVIVPVERRVNDISSLIALACRWAAKKRPSSPVMIDLSDEEGANG